MDQKVSLFDLQLNPVRIVFYSINLILISYFLLKSILPRLYFVYHYTRWTNETLPCHPIWGHLKLIMPKFPNPNYKMEEATAKLYNILKKSSDDKKEVDIIWLSWLPLVIVSGHRAVETLLNKQNLTKPWFYKFLLMREGLISSKPDKWRVRRKQVEPFFVTKKLKKFLHFMNFEMCKLADELKDKVDEPVDFDSMVPPKVFNIISKAVWGMRDGDYPELLDKSLYAIDVGSNIVMQRFFNPLLWFDFTAQFLSVGKAYKKNVKLNEFLFNKYIDLSKKHKINDPILDKMDYDLLDTLADQNVDEEGQAEEGITAVIAGHETTSTSIQWALFNLGNNPEIQERLYQEIVSIFPVDTPVADLEKVNQCQFLDQCIKETLRLHPPVPMFWRCLDEDTIINGKKILSGTIVAISVLGTHSDSKIYPNPSEFDPDRWSPENAIEIPKSAFIPFAYGPRTCIGNRYAMNEIKTCLIHILRKMKVRSLLKLEDIGYRAEVSLKSTKPLKMIFSLRNEINKN